MLLAASDTAAIVTQTLLAGSVDQQFVGQHAVSSCNDGWPRPSEVAPTPVAIAPLLSSSAGGLFASTSRAVCPVGKANGSKTVIALTVI
jgi:hypothetical protein